MADREDVRFPSGEADRAGGLYAPRPVSGAFAAAGYAALASLTHFGDSGGEPRRLLDIRRQLDD